MVGRNTIAARRRRALKECAAARHASVKENAAAGCQDGAADHFDEDKLALAGKSMAEVREGIKDAIEKRELPAGEWKPCAC